MFLTSTNRVQNAIRFKNSATFWFGVGRTTPWSDESTPPSVDTSATALDELVGVQKASTVSLVYPDAGGLITYRGQNYTVSTDGNALANDAKFVLISTTLAYDTFPLTTFRQVGLYSDIVGTPAEATILLPGAISDLGALEGIDNREAITRAIDGVQTLSYIISF